MHPGKMMPRVPLRSWRRCGGRLPFPLNNEHIGNHAKSLSPWRCPGWPLRGRGSLFRFNRAGACPRSVVPLNLAAGFPSRSNRGARSPGREKGIWTGMLHSSGRGRFPCRNQRTGSWSKSFEFEIYRFRKKSIITKCGQDARAPREKTHKK